MITTKELNLIVENDFFIFSLKKMNFREHFVHYDNVLAFYCFFLNLQAEKNQQLIFDLDEIIFNGSLTIGQKHARFLRL